MKKIVAILAAISLTTLSAGAAGVGFFGAYWDTDEAGDGFGGGGKLLLDLGGVVDIEFRGGYFQDLSTDGVDIDLEVIPIEAGVTVNILGSEAPYKIYVGGGVGYYMLDTDAGDLDDEAGWYGLAGIQVPLGESVSVFAEGVWRQIEGTAEGDDIDELVEDVDIALDGLGGNVGIILGW